jgi:hypothetical protein
MVDRVTWRAAHAEELRLGLSRIADAGDVLVAVAIDLRRAHDHVPASRPDDIEDGAIRQPALDVAGSVDERRDTVGEHEVRRERRARQACGEAGQDADRAGEDLAVAAKRLGERDRADFVTSGGPVRPERGVFAESKGHDTYSW